MNADVSKNTPVPEVKKVDPAKVNAPAPAAVKSAAPAEEKPPRKKSSKTIAADLLNDDTAAEAKKALAAKWAELKKADEKKEDVKTVVGRKAFDALKAEIVSELNEGKSVSAIFKRFVEVAGEGLTVKAFQTSINNLISDKSSGVSEVARVRIQKRADTARQAAEKRKANPKPKADKK